ncbi:hypothetical protein LX36DRAFT_620653 [Colletotrichum falcatum]|nr:hypothetical protein LX36DRAFT_620653 [Colletotrichum falcatum]
MGAVCSSNADCKFKDDPTDADIMGIGVLLAFVVPVLLSNVIIYLAYIARNTFDAAQYMEIDKRILERLERQRSVLAFIRSMEYRQIILGLSDQLLVTSIGILIAVYVQTCSMSLLCFQVGEALAYLASGVHMNCLMALGSYFEEHRRQARGRIWLMVFLLVFILVTNSLTYLTYYNSQRRTIACAIRHFKTDWPYLFVAWLAVSWWIASGFLNSICHLRNARSDFPAVYSMVHWALGVVYRDGVSRRELEAWNDDERQKTRMKYSRRCRRLRQRSPKLPWRVTAPIVAWSIVGDFWRSLILNIFVNLSFTVTGLYFLVGILVTASIDYKALLEPKFGQVLPLVMLVVLLLNITEASGPPSETYGKIKARNGSSPRPSTETEELTLVPPERISRQGANEWVIPPERQASGVEDHWHPGAEATMSGGLFRRLAEDTAREQQMHADCQTTTIISDASEASGVRLPSRANTFGIEAGIVREAESNGEVCTRFDLAAVVYEDTPRWVIKLAFFATLAMVAGFFYSLVEYFEETAIAVCASSLLYQLGHICSGFWRFRRFRRARGGRRRGRPAAA